MTNYQMTNPDCAYCEKREMDVDCSAMMEKYEQGCEGGEIWIGREGGGTFQAKGIGRVRYVQGIECF